MIDSWAVSTNEYKNKSQDFNPSLPVMPNHNVNRGINSNPTRNDYEKYLWLFGK
jgi:hypothetical protein